MNMKIILIENKIIVADNYRCVKEKNCDLEVDLQFIPLKKTPYNLEVSYNGAPWEPIGKLPDWLKDEYALKMEIKLTYKATQEEHRFVSDEIPIQRYLMLGSDYETAYPQVIQELRNQIKKLDERLKKLEDVGDIL